MKDELQLKLVEILTSIQTATGKAADFTMSQLPDIAQSYIAYGRVLYLVGVVIGAALAGVCAWRYCVNHANFERDPRYEVIVSRSDRQSTAMFLYTLIGFCSAIWAALSLQGALLVWLSPKVWLLKEIASLVK